jgi:hypothetical protein
MTFCAYPPSYAAKKAVGYRHDARDYEYSINKIEGIYDHQVVVRHGFAFSAADVLGWGAVSHRPGLARKRLQPWKELVQRQLAAQRCRCTVRSRVIS